VNDGPTDGGGLTAAGARWMLAVAAVIEAAWLAGLLWLVCRQ
jgi:hypothetical protein